MPVNAFRITADLLGVFSSHSFRVHALFSFAHTFRCLGAAVVKASEPVVPRHFRAAIITFEIPVMQLMVERPDLQVGLIPKHQVFETGMRRG